jgi:hypothetical protein
MLHNDTLRCSRQSRQSALYFCILLYKYRKYEEFLYEIRLLKNPVIERLCKSKCEFLPNVFTQFKRNNKMSSWLVFRVLWKYAPHVAVQARTIDTNWTRFSREPASTKVNQMAKKDYQLCGFTACSETKANYNVLKCYFITYIHFPVTF